MINDQDTTQDFIHQPDNEDNKAGSIGGNMVVDMKLTDMLFETYHDEFKRLVHDLGLGNFAINVAVTQSDNDELPSGIAHVRDIKNGYVLFLNRSEIYRDGDMRLSLLESALWLKSIWHGEKGPYKRKFKHGTVTDDELYTIFIDAVDYASEAVQRLFGLFHPDELEAWKQQRMPDDRVLAA